MGGTVYLPHGTFFTGSLRIYSDTTFFLDTEAELIGTQVTANIRCTRQARVCARPASLGGVCFTQKMQGIFE